MSSNIESIEKYVKDHILLYEDSDDDFISKEVFLTVLQEINNMLTKKSRVHQFIIDNNINIYGDTDNPVVNRIYYVPENGEYYFCRDDNTLEKI